MTVSGVSSNIAPLIQSALDINKQLDDLQRQLGVGQKSDTYAGLGLAKRRRRRAERAVVRHQRLQRHDHQCRNDASACSRRCSSKSPASAARFNRPRCNRVLPSTAPARPRRRKRPQSQLDQILSLLNTQGGNRYLFSGSGLNQPSVDTADHILNGNGAQAGLKQVIAERNQADLGADGLGRLVIPAAAGTTVAVSEDAAGSPFGLKLAGGQFDADRRDRDRPCRLAGLDFGRSRGDQSE